MKKIILTIILAMGLFSGNCFYNHTSPTHIAAQSIIMNNAINSSRNDYEKNLILKDSITYNKDSIISRLHEIEKDRERKSNSRFLVVSAIFIVLIGVSTFLFINTSFY